MTETLFDMNVEDTKVRYKKLVAEMNKTLATLNQIMEYQKAARKSGVTA